MSLARTAPAIRPAVPLVAALSLFPVLGSWWWLVHDQVAAAGVALEAMPITPDGLAWIAVFTRAGGWGVEAAAYAIVWTALDARLPWGRYALALGALSVFDLCADALRLHAPAFGEGARGALAAIAGPGALGPFAGEWRLLGAAFTAAGLLALARIAVAAFVQSRLAGVPWRAAFGLTLGLWLTHHVALWWIFELTAGRSLPGEIAP